MGVIAVIGSGNIGGTIGRALARAGLDVVFGSRDPLASKAAGETAARVATVAEAVAEADTVLLAVPGGGVPALLRDHGAALDGKLVVDASNNFPGPVLNAAAAVAELAPGARYARAFNSQPWESYAEPTWDGVRGDLVFTARAGADEVRVAELIEAVGLRPYYVGPDKQDLADAVLWLLFPELERSGRHVGLHILGRG